MLLNLELPYKDIYYEKSSPDAYCFHGLSLVNINKKEESKFFFQKIKNLNFRFGLPKNTLIQNYYSDDIILYTYFWCYLFTRNHYNNMAI